MTATRRTVVGAMTALAVMAITIMTPVTATAQQPLEQVKLTEDAVKRYLAAQTAMNPIFEKLPPPDSATPPDPKVKAELEALAKKHGFATQADFDNVAYSVSLVMAGLDPSTGAFTEASAAIKLETERVKADKSIPEAEKKKMLEELADAAKTAQPIKFPENIELVKKYFKEIEKVLG